jgi:hypothetical protein
MEATFCKKLAFVVVVMGLALTVGSAVASAQSDGPYQFTYFTNARQALDGKVRVVNDGATATVALPTANGQLCANFYVLSNEELSECCACSLTIDGGRELSINNDLTSNPGSGAPLLKKGVIEMLATTLPSGGCNPATVGTGTNLLSTGLSALITHVQAVLPNLSFPVTEEEFQQGTLSAAELVRITTLCGFIQISDAGKGICTCGTTF